MPEIILNINNCESDEKDVGLTMEFSKNKTVDNIYFPPLLKLHYEINDDENYKRMKGKSYSDISDEEIEDLLHKSIVLKATYLYSRKQRDIELAKHLHYHGVGDNVIRVALGINQDELQSYYEK